jgi:hypothetical protein
MKLGESTPLLAAAKVGDTAPDTTPLEFELDTGDTIVCQCPPLTRRSLVAGVSLLVTLALTVPHAVAFVLASDQLQHQCLLDNGFLQWLAAINVINIICGVLVWTLPAMNGIERGRKTRARLLLLYYLLVAATLISGIVKVISAAQSCAGVRQLTMSLHILAILCTIFPLIQAIFISSAVDVTHYDLF